MTNHLPASDCPSCGAKLDAASILGEKEDAQPNPGDITLCFYCGHLMAFGSNLLLRSLTKEEMIAIAGDPRIIAAQRARKEVRR